MKKHLLTIAFALSMGIAFSQTQTNKFPDDGNVGIGTTSPQSKLDVKGDITANSVIRALNPNNNQSMVFLGWLDNVARLRIGGSGIGAGGGFDLQITGDQSIMRFLNNGNIGVGTTNPATKFDINGGLSVSGANPINGINNFRNSIQIKAPSHGAIVYNPGEATELMFGFHSNGNFYWGNSTTYAMELSNAGNAKIYNTLAVGGNLKTGSVLSVKGKIAAQEVEVTTSNWPDYVFEEGYQIQSLAEIESFIKTNKHLPEIPNSEQVANEGVKLGEMNKLLLKKVEELTLHVISLRKELDEVKKNQQ